MGLREKMLERIEKNSIAVDVDGEKIYLKKSGNLKEWRVIYPPVNPETMKWNWINLLFGGKGNAIKTLVIGILATLLAIGVYDIVNSYNAVMNNPTVQSCLESQGWVFGS